ncbi:MAG TPA: AarF/UbiB family protein [Dermatophilaceae bacterium]|nr:AarF/UbiB family protein [Dermatophilaceae bacterium]
MGLLLALAVIVAFAAVVRGALAARGVSWPRLLLAAFLGYGLGAAVGALLLLGPVDLATVGTVQAPEPSELAAVALPFQLLVTMALVVGLELVASRPPRRHRVRLVNPLAAARREVGVARCGLEVTRVAARTGIGPVLGLTRGGRGTSDPDVLSRQVREAVEELGGVVVKLGQLLATRPDLLPPAVLAELGRLHSSVSPVPLEELRVVLRAEGDLDSRLVTIDPTPLGSASIAQVHVARLADGAEVVVKVQRPGLADVVERDLAILDRVAATVERRTDWGRQYRVRRIAADLAAQLRAEMDFRTEARDVAEVAGALRDEPSIRVPAVLLPATRRTLVNERLHGIPLSAHPSGTPVAGGEELADALCRSQIRAMLAGERFHGDPHPGNVVLLDGGGLGLLDFGMTGRLDSFGRGFVLQLLGAVPVQDAGLLYEALLTGGSVGPEADRDAVERELAAFLTAHLTSTLPSVSATTELLRLTTRLGLAVPDSAAVMFRALGTLAGTLEMLSPGYPFIERVADQAGVELRSRMAPSSGAELLQREWATLGPVLRRVPRHLDRITTQLAAGQLSTRPRLLSHPEDRRVVERVLDKALMAVLGLGLLAVSVAMIAVEAGPVIVTADVTLLSVLGWLTLFAGTVLVLRVLLDVLRER